VPEELVRLQKAISQAGLMSRRAAEELIRAGRVTIDGRVAQLGDRVDPAASKVLVDGVPLPLSPALVTYLTYKPAGVVSTMRDPEGRPTIRDLVPAEPRVVPVGRLDYDSEGLLLMSNDGELIQRVTHPGFGVTKTYVASVLGNMTTATVRKLVAGVDLDDGPARAARARLVQSSGARSLVEVVMEEGRNREVRRLLEAVGHPVERLVRVAIGPLRDRQLQPGKWRLLSPDEVRGLYAAAGGDPDTQSP
jgi:23S rRNA pseudouridine2605 synthase